MESKEIINNTKEVDPLAVRIIKQSESEKSPQDMQLLIEDFLKNQELRDNDHNALIAYLILNTSYQLPDEYSKELMKILHKGRDEIGLFVKTMERAQMLRLETAGFFKHSQNKTKFIEVSPLDDFLAMEVLAFEANHLSTLYRIKFEEEKRSTYNIESYRHPSNGAPGLWMSVDGSKFESSKIQ